MKERPIIFNPAMIRAILEGRKTVTRRVVKIQPNSIYKTAHFNGDGFHFETYCGSQSEIIQCPHGKIGDELWVRETWRFLENPETGEDWVKYKAGGEMMFPNVDNLKYSGDPFDGRWRPSIHMSRWMSRIQLEITDIRVEQIQDITPGDILREGTPNTDIEYNCPWSEIYGDFQHLWDSINLERGFGWEVNPFVWVLEFRRI